MERNKHITHRNFLDITICLHGENVENIVDRMKRSICTQESAAGDVYPLPSARTKEFLTRYILYL